MQLGVVFPQTEIGNDPRVIRDHAVTAEQAGFDFLCVFDHVLGARPHPPERPAGPYTHRTPFHEVLVLLAHLAAVTERLELATEILVLPQRQTALAAKQAASLDVLSGGRLRLGVGLGWNSVEYEALGEDFHNRGRRIEEQVELMRALWRDELVTFDGRWHRFSDAGLNPLPVRRSIPVWMGGTAEPALRRIARIADGWMMTQRLSDDLRAMHRHVLEMVAEHGRDPQAFGVAGRVAWTGDVAATVEQLHGFEEMGVSHVSINTMNAGIAEPRDHIRHCVAVLEAWRAG